MIKSLFNISIFFLFAFNIYLNKLMTFFWRHFHQWRWRQAWKVVQLQHHVKVVPKRKTKHSTRDHLHSYYSPIYPCMSVNTIFFLVWKDGNLFFMVTYYLSMAKSEIRSKLNSISAKMKWHFTDLFEYKWKNDPWFRLFWFLHHFYFRFNG